MKKIGTILMALMVLSATVGIVGAETIPTTVIALAGDLAAIVITPANPTVTPGTTQPFTATGTDVDGNIVTITPVWSANTNAGTIDPNTGLLTAPSMTDSIPGNYNVVADAVVNGIAKQGMAVVTIPTIVAISITEPIVDYGEVQIGKTSTEQLGVSNTGNVVESLTVTVGDMESGLNLLSRTNVEVTKPGAILKGTIGTVGLALTIPTGTVLGTYTGTIEVMASAQT